MFSRGHSFEIRHLMMSVLAGCWKSARKLFSETEIHSGRLTLGRSHLHSRYHRAACLPGACAWGTVDVLPVDYETEPRPVPD